MVLSNKWKSMHQSMVLSTFIGAHILSGESDSAETRRHRSNILRRYGALTIMIVSPIDESLSDITLHGRLDNCNLGFEDLVRCGALKHIHLQFLFSLNIFLAYSRFNLPDIWFYPDKNACFFLYIFSFILFRHHTFRMKRIAKFLSR